MPIPHLRLVAFTLAACLSTAPGLAQQPSDFEKLGNWRVSPAGGPMCLAARVSESGFPLVLHPGPERLLYLSFISPSAAKAAAPADVATIALDGKRMPLSASGIAIPHHGKAVPVDPDFLSAFADAHVLEMIGKDGRTIERFEIEGAAQVVPRMRSCAAAAKALPTPPSGAQPPIPSASAADTSGPRRAQPVVPAFRVMSDMDYPAAALRAGEQGTVTFRLDIAADGRVTGCTVLVSSGSAILDAETCRVMSTRLRFHPARDANGKAMADRMISRIAWRLPQTAPPPAEPQQ